MKCIEICEILDKNIPKELAYSWDNIGLLVGDKEQEIKKIYIALDATDNIIEDAIHKGADMILTHHPLIFTPLKSVTSENFIANRVLNLIKNNIALYAMHTNYDIERMADVVADKLTLINQKPLEVTTEDGLKGLGKVGELKQAMTIEEIALFVKKQFVLPGISVYEVNELDKSNYQSTDQEMLEDNKTYRKLALLPGSGKSAINQVIKQGIEVFITGDITHHEGIDASSRGLNIIDAGHYGLEHIFIEDMKKQLEILVPELEIITEPIKHPVKYL